MAIDADPATPGRFKVMSIPTLLLLRDGAEIARRDGLIRDADLEGLLAEAAATGKHSTRQEG